MKVAGKIRGALLLAMTSALHVTASKARRSSPAAGMLLMNLASGSAAHTDC